MNRKTNLNDLNTNALIEWYEAQYGIQGDAVYSLSRKQLIDGLTNPNHIPARDRRNRRQGNVTPADYARLMS